MNLIFIKHSVILVSISSELTIIILRQLFIIAVYGGLLQSDSLIISQLSFYKTMYYRFEGF